MKSQNLEKQPTTTNPEGERLPKAQFSKFRFVKPTLRIDKSQTTSGKAARFDDMGRRKSQFPPQMLCL